jgi:hypothetical protein
VTSPARSPRYSRFIVVGAVVGAVLGVGAALVQGGDRVGQGVAYVGCFLALVGGLLAGILAILLDRPGRPEQQGEADPDPRSVAPPEQRASSAP